jgi:hypothetical protein
MSSLLPELEAGAAGGGYIREIQVAGGCKHAVFAAVGVCDDRGKPGERMMGQLELRAEAISGQSNSQDIANTLWAFATIRVVPFARLKFHLLQNVNATRDSIYCKTRQ